MAITQNTYTGNGSTVLYSFAFPYLATTDVKVSLNGVVTTAYTFANATTIQFNTAPANGAAIRIYRETSDATLQAVFSPGSSIRASDLNDNFDQLIYLGQEANTEADSATSTANTALTNSNTAISTANTASTNASNAVTTANTASANASAAVTTANTASTNASAAVSTANTASTNASNAVTTANTALSTANSATTTANNATTTANTALSAANTAVSTANTASSNATAAVNTSNTANSNANTALTTANNAVTTANTALSTANTANTKADTAIAAVSNSINYTLIANVAAIPGSPANNTYIEVADSTGIESFTPLTGLPGGYVGDSGLTIRLKFTTAGSTWNFLNYYPNNSETRYLKLAGGNMTGPLVMNNQQQVRFRETTANGTNFLAVQAPASLAADKTLTLPDATGTLVSTGDTGTVTSTMIADGTIVNADINASAAIAGTKISPDFGSQNTTTTGTSTAASFIPSSSTAPTNGLYLPAANSVGLATGGSGRLFVDSSGRVGIGVTPAAKLDVNAASGTLFRAEYPGVAQLNIANGGSSLNYYDGDTQIFRSGGGTERLRITSGGLVGIGNSSPSTILHASKDVNNNTDGITLTNNNGGTDNGSAISFRGAFGAPFQTDQLTARINGFTPNPNGTKEGVIAFSTGTGGTLTERMRLTPTGLGIGTASPSRELHVSGSSDNLRSIRIENTNTGTSALANVSLASDSASLDLYATSGAYAGITGWSDSGVISTGSDTSGGLILNAQAGGIKFQYGTGEKARIDTSGRLLVGTSSSSTNVRAIFQASSGNSSGGGIIRIAAGNNNPTNNGSIGYIGFCDNSHADAAYITARSEEHTS